MLDRTSEKAGDIVYGILFARSYIDHFPPPYCAARHGQKIRLSDISNIDEIPRLLSVTDNEKRLAFPLLF